MIYVKKSQKSVSEIEKEFPQVAARHKFGVLGIHNLRQKMKEKGIPFEKDCLVFEVCNPQQARKILEGNMSISTALPCRVSVYEEGERTVIATIRPTALLSLFDEPELQAVAQEVEQSLLQIMEKLS